VSATRRPGYFDADDLVALRLDRLSDLAESQLLADDVRELIRWAVAELAAAKWPEQEPEPDPWQAMRFRLLR
jgi:hypothetical protein